MSKSRSFRDYHYDHSDVLLAVIILAIAACLILWRINIIMDYPKTLDQSSGTTVTSSENITTSEADSSSKESTESSGTNKATWDNDKLAEEISMSVEGSNSDKRIQCLIDAGLFTSSVDFETVCKDNNLNPKKIRAGSYTFSKGLTKTNIAKAVVKTKKK